MRRFLTGAAASTVAVGGTAFYSLWTGKLEPINNLALQQTSAFAGWWWQFSLDFDRANCALRDGTFSVRHAKFKRKTQHNVEFVLGSLQGRLAEPGFKGLLSSRFRSELAKDVLFDKLQVEDLLGYIQFNVQNTLADATTAAASRVIDRAIDQSKANRDYIASSVLLKNVWIDLDFDSTATIIDGRCVTKVPRFIIQQLAAEKLRWKYLTHDVFRYADGSGLLGHNGSFEFKEGRSCVERVASFKSIPLELFPLKNFPLSMIESAQVDCTITSLPVQEDPLTHRRTYMVDTEAVVHQVKLKTGVDKVKYADTPVLKSAILAIDSLSKGRVAVPDFTLSLDETNWTAETVVDQVRDHLSAQLTSSVDRLKTQVKDAVQRASTEAKRLVSGG